MNIDFIKDLLAPVNLMQITNDEGFKPNQIGSIAAVYEDAFPDLQDVDVVIVGCGEYRGGGNISDSFKVANSVRKHFYELFHWHKNVRVADIGNLKTGFKLADSRSALQAIITDIATPERKVIIIGGSHDNVLAQSNALSAANRLHEYVNVDAKIDLDSDSPEFDQSFLIELFTQNPNFIQHYNHIGFQSYFVQPHMLETIDKLRFDCYRVGRVKDNIEEMEPIFRNSQLASFDITAFANAYAPANKLSPNGFNGEEMCRLFKFAGLSNSLETVGLYGFVFHKDVNELTACQLGHCLWYFLDGIYEAKRESPFSDSTNYNEYYLAFSEVQTTFIQSKKTGRWWMQLPNKRFIACSYSDYNLASQNEIPERYLRAVERES